MKRTIIAAGLLVIASLVQADDIGFGTVKGIKVYDHSGSKVTKIYLADDATNKTLACGGVADITHSMHPDLALKQMVTVALTASATGKKVRIASSTNTCEADFIALQESYF